MTSVLLTYSEKHALSFVPAVQIESSIESKGGIFEVRYDFSSSSDGYRNADLEFFQNEYPGWLEGYETDNSPTGYLYVYLELQLDRESKSECVWLHHWRDEEEMATATVSLEDR